MPNYTVRLDHVFNEKNRGYFRFTDIRQEQQALRNYPSDLPGEHRNPELNCRAPPATSASRSKPSAARSVTRKSSRPPSSRRPSYSMQWQRMYVQGNDVPCTTMKSSSALPNNLATLDFPRSAANLFMPYGGSQWYYGMSQRLSTLDENLNKIWGKHQFAFGGRCRHENFGYLSDRSVDEFNYTNQATGIYDPATGANYGVSANTGNQNADFFLGAAAPLTPERRNAPFNICSLWEYDSYFQDNWRVIRRLTLNLGLRWEAHPAAHAANDYMVTFDIKNNALASPRPLDYYVQNGLTTQRAPHQSAEPRREVRNPRTGRSAFAGIRAQQCELPAALRLRLYTSFGRGWNRVSAAVTASTSIRFRSATPSAT